MSLFKNRTSRSQEANEKQAPASAPSSPAYQSGAVPPMPQPAHSQPAEAMSDPIPTSGANTAQGGANGSSTTSESFVQDLTPEAASSGGSGHRGFAAKFGRRSSGGGSANGPDGVDAADYNSAGMGSASKGNNVNSPQMPKGSHSDSEDAIRPTGGYTPPPEFKVVRESVQQFLVNQSGVLAGAVGAAEVRQLLEPVFRDALEKANLIVSRTERQRMFDLILSDILGYGPIQPLLDDDTITEVMVNNADTVYIEQNGKITRTNVSFMDDNHVLQVIDRIVSPLGRRIDESSPMVDARLPDGSRVNAIIPPLALKGPCITIRKFRADPFTIDDLIEFGSITPEFALFIDACVKSHLNIVVSGGTGSGKTTMLNVLSSCIPEDDRIVTIEDAAELQLQQPHVISLEKRAANIEGKGEVNIRDLVVNSLRMRPDRIVVGECRSGEALDMLQAMNTGHDGSLTTIHSNSARDTLNRTETLVMMAGMDLPLRAIRQQVAAAIDMIVHVERMRDGGRRMVQCAEVMGMEGETIVLQDLFLYEQTGMDEDGKLIGSLKSTGLRPRATKRIADAGITLPANIFGVDVESFWDD